MLCILMILFVCLHMLMFDFYSLMCLGSFSNIVVTGTAVPVVVDIKPSTSFNFGHCPVGDQVDIFCSIHNVSSPLPVTYKFSDIAHFTANPSSKTISPGHYQDVVLSFVPKQIGELIFCSLLYNDNEVGDVALGNLM